MWKEPDVASFEVLPWYLLKGLKKKKPQKFFSWDSQSLGLDFNPEPPQIKRKTVCHWTAQLTQMIPSQLPCQDKHNCLRRVLNFMKQPANLYTMKLSP
jgi:hypothetical protein